MDHPDHPVVQVRIVGARVGVVCGCGWKSPPRANESKARTEHEAHVKAKEKVSSGRN